MMGSTYLHVCMRGKTFADLRADLNYNSAFTKCPKKR